MLKDFIHRLAPRLPQRVAATEETPDVAAEPTFDVSKFPTDNYKGLIAWPHTIPLPNTQLIGTVSYGTLEQFYIIGEAWAQLVARFQPDEPVVLDLGCGCGKLARFLYLNPRLRYIGIDIFAPSITWCSRAFADLAGDRFSFEHFDGYSTVWNPKGKLSASEYSFPIEDGGVNFVVAASLFTHLLEDDCKHYLNEIGRVLRPGGLALISIHDQPADGEWYSGDHARIDINCGYFVGLAGARRLNLKEDVGNFIGQRALLFEKS